MSHSSSHESQPDPPNIIVGALIICQKHEKFAVTKRMSSDHKEIVWIPCEKLTEAEAWTPAVVKLINSLFPNGSINDPELVHINHRLIHNKWFKQAIFRSTVKEKSKSKESPSKEPNQGCICHAAIGNINWEPTDHLMKVITGHEKNDQYKFCREVLSVQKSKSPSQESIGLQSGYCRKHRPQDYCLMPKILKTTDQSNLQFSQVINHHDIQNPIPKVMKFAHELLEDPTLTRVLKMVHETLAYKNQVTKDLHGYDKLKINDPKQKKKKSKSKSGEAVKISGPWFKSPQFDQHVKDIIHVLRLAREIFSSEPKVLKIQSPVYVFGDIHGYLQDLLIYDKHILRMTSNVQSNYLFLGDYVDRGKDCVECVMYLFIKKIIFRDKFFMLRGNHEIMELQQMFSFMKECQEKFGHHANSNLGNKMWIAFNEVFEVMPIAAIIDESIYCAHGGIPYSEVNLDKVLSMMPKVMRCPDKMPGGGILAWEIMWNDPISEKEKEEFMELMRVRSGDERIIAMIEKGYMDNGKRSTAYVFTQAALETFFRVNGLTHVIRAHEVEPNGWKSHFGGKCWTVFSASRYYKENSSACMLVTDNQIKIIKFKTF